MLFCGSHGLLLNPWQGGVWLNWLKYQSLRDSLSETSSSSEITCFARVYPLVSLSVVRHVHTLASSFCSHFPLLDISSLRVGTTV